MSKKDKIFVATIYGYDNMNHEKYQCSVDYFIDNYKEFAKPARRKGITIW